MSVCRPFSALLVANRGEIACRIIATARKMGLRTIAVYSEADAGARHCRLADEAHAIGPAAAQRSYLDIRALLAVARATGAQALHPGYGFLAESPALAEACAAAGLVFVGPPASVMASLGDKAAAKERAAAKKVPLLPGYHGPEQDAALLAREAARIGYPLLIKAKAGGGGRGMRLVESPDAFADALAAARREAEAAFGSSEVLLESYLTAPRHVEVQILADSGGRVVHLFDRDCSLQRRHQKVVEEAPAPFLEPELQAAMAQAACRLIEGSEYLGAATVEFMVQGDDFYFLEINTRLQVEHPVTEMITGLDLVEWQLRIAMGETLPDAFDELRPDGHAVEARLYAEDPLQNFMPAAGTVLHAAFPATFPATFPAPTPDAKAALRSDSAVESGDRVSDFYDPMIAKVVAKGADRTSAFATLASGLAACQFVGPANNLAFLRALVALVAKADKPLNTAYLEKAAPEILARLRAEAEAPPSPLPLALLGLADLLHVRNADAVSDPAPPSPWESRDAWRQAGRPGRIFRDYSGAVDGCGRVLTLVFSPRGRGYDISLPDGRMVHGEGRLQADGTLQATLDGQNHDAAFFAFGNLRVLFLESLDPHPGNSGLRLYAPDWLGLRPAAGAATGRILAPLSGRIAAVKVKPGDWVEEGMTLMLLEAMKMEHAITAPGAGNVSAVTVAAGDQVQEGRELLQIGRDRQEISDSDTSPQPDDPRYQKPLVYVSRKRDGPG